MAIPSNTTLSPRVVSHEQWVNERTAFLAKEKEFNRLRDDLSRQRRELPWERVGKPYSFDGPNGPETLADLFQGRSQLIVYHFMYGPEMKEGCPGCSFVADHIDSTLPHLAARDVTLVVASRAPYPTLEAFKQRMGWGFKWVSSQGSDFNYDFGVSFTDKQRASGSVPYNYGSLKYRGADKEGASSFVREGEEIFHTYSTYARGVEAFLGTYGVLDLAPRGRDEEKLDSPMSWVRHHDRYQG